MQGKSHGASEDIRRAPGEGKAAQWKERKNREPERVYTEAEIKEENRKIRHLRRLVDFSLALIAQSPMPIEEARDVVKAVRQHAVALFSR